MLWPGILYLDPPTCRSDVTITFYKEPMAAVLPWPPESRCESSYFAPWLFSKGRSKRETSTTECQTGTLWCFLTLPMARRVHEWGCREETQASRLRFGKELRRGCSVWHKVRHKELNNLRKKVQSQFVSWVYTSIISWFRFPEISVERRERRKWFRLH